MQRHTRARTARTTVAATTVLGIAIGLCAAITSPALAAAPHLTTAVDGEVVVPNPGSLQPRSEDLGQVGATGYAHKRQGSAGWVWTDFATGTDKAITEAQAHGHSGLYATYDATTREATVTDLATGEQRLRVTLPEGRRWTGVYNADTVVTTDDGYPDSVQLLRLVDDKPTEVASFPLGEAFEGRMDVLDQDAKGALLRFFREGDQFPVGYMVDYAKGTLSPASAAGEGTTVSLGDQHVLEVSHTSYANSVWTDLRSDPSAPTVRTDLPKPANGLYGLAAYETVGDWVVFVRPLTEDERSTSLGAKLQAVRIGTGEVKDLLPHAAPELSGAPDGSVLAVGGTDGRDWAVRRVTIGADGTPKLTTVTKVPPLPATYQGLALGGGRLSYLADDLPYTGPGLYDVDTDLTAAPATAGEPTLRHRLTPGVTRVVAGGDGDTVYAGSGHLYSPIDTSSLRSAELPARSKVLDAAGRYALAENGDTTYAVDLENRTSSPDVLLTLTNSAAALWDAQVWKSASATTTDSKVNAYDLRTRTTSPAVDLGSGCKPTELQAVDRWLYWACGTDKAGVYDRTANKSVAVPVGEALLGDGFVVRHEGDKLKVTDAATGGTTDLADLPAAASGSGRRSTWTVDKFGGGVAYVDAERNIHVRKTGVAAQPMTRLQESVPDLDLTGGGVEPAPATWSPVWRFSKPVGSWELRIVKGNGEVVRTLTGTKGVGAAVRAHWDGKDAKDRGIESGQYRWELITRPLDGVGPAQGSSGAFRVGGSSLTTAPGTFTPVTPSRLLDTRSGLGAPAGKVGPGGTKLLKVAGRAGVPAEGLTSVVL
ncbi:hypothetical protein ACIGO8_31080, partial [Streptomyces sp. NPDC053493]|uniref:hypothetical protein n=1 Tax=Streptomyces sp. NPDC053493 TaxID=3365705 RepID=UPI0037CDBB78